MILIKLHEYSKVYMNIIIHEYWYRIIIFDIDKLINLILIKYKIKDSFSNLILIILLNYSKRSGQFKLISAS